MTQQFFQVVDPARASYMGGFTAKTADELCNGLLCKINDDGTVSAAGADDKPAGVVQDNRLLLYRPTGVYAAAGEPITVIGGHVEALCDASFFSGATLPSALAPLYSAAGGLMATTGSNHIGMAISTQDDMRWPPNTSQNLVRVLLSFTGKDI